MHFTLRIRQESQVSLPAFLRGAGGEREELDDIERAKKAAEGVWASNEYSSMILKFRVDGLTAEVRNSGRTEREREEFGGRPPSPKAALRSIISVGLPYNSSSHQACSSPRGCTARAIPSISHSHANFRRAESPSSRVWSQESERDVL
jgi:hypothetical protein